MLYRLWIWFLQCLGFDPRGLFAYFDGQRIRHVDPIVIARELWSVKIKQSEKIPDVNGLPNVSSLTMTMAVPELPFDAAESRKLIATGIGTQMAQGYDEIAQAVRIAFNVRPLNAGGLSELECSTLLDRFEDYLGDVKKNGSGKPIKSPSTDSLPEDEFSTSNESGFGSISTDSNSEQPEPLDLD